MKKLITTLLLCFCILQSFGQKPKLIYADAVKLSNWSQSNNTEERASFYLKLLEYGIDENSVANNPFLSKFKSKFIEQDSLNKKILTTNNNKKNNTGIESTLTKEAKNNLSTMAIADKAAEPVGNLQAVAINAIATFMADRFKQETLQMGIDNLFKYITKNQATAFRNLFPKTFQQMNILYNTHEYYSVDIIYLKQLAALDLSTMGKNVAGLFSNRDTLLAIIPKSDSTAIDIFVLGGSISYNILDGKSLPQLINNVTNKSYKNPNIKEFTRLINIISNAMRSNRDGGDFWVKPDDDELKLNISDINSSSNTALFFYGLLYQTIITDPNLPKTQAFIATATTQENSLLLKELITLAKSLNNTRKILVDNDFKINSYDDFLTLVQSITSLSETFANSTVIVNTLKINVTNLKKINTYANIVIGFYKSVQGDYKLGMAALLSEIAPYIKDPKLLRTIMFVSQLLEVNNPDDMEALLKTYALPIGSSSIKRNSPFNISLNGYVGTSAGMEFSKQLWSFNYGLTAPIGLTFSFAPTKCGSLSLFLSAIDIGAVVNQRLNGDDVYYTKLRFNQFYAPGGGIFYNIRRTPLTLGFSGTYYPSLTYFDFDKTTGEPNPTTTIKAWRANFSLLVDIPFFTIYNKSNMLRK